MSDALVYPTYYEATVGSGDCIVKEALTSSAGAGTLTGDNTASAAFSSRGFSSSDGTGLASIDFAGVTGIDNAIYGFTMYFEIEKAVFERGGTDATVQGFFNTTQSGVSHTPYFRRDLNVMRANMGSGAVSAYSNGNRHDTYVPVWITGGWGWYKIYVNYIERISGGWNTLNAVFTHFQLGGQGVAASVGLKNVAVKNVAIWTKSMILPSTHGLTVGFFGNSYAETGTYELASLGSAIPCETPDGLTSSTFDGSANYYDDGMVPVCHAELAKAGFRVTGNRILHWAEGGSGMVHLSTTSSTIALRIDEAIKGFYPQLDIAVLVFGYNDLNDTTNVPDADLTNGTYQATVQTNIDKLTAKGIKIIICNQIWPNGGSANVTQTRVTNFNTVLNSLTGVDKVIDMFTEANGFSNTNTIDGVHPGRSLMPVYGQKIATEIMKIA